LQQLSVQAERLFQLPHAAESVIVDRLHLGSPLSSGSAMRGIAKSLNIAAAIAVASGPVRIGVRTALKSY
jgi:hypothetical protein